MEEKLADKYACRVCSHFCNPDLNGHCREWNAIKQAVEEALKESEKEKEIMRNQANCLTYRKGHCSFLKPINSCCKICSHWALYSTDTVISADFK